MTYTPRYGSIAGVKTFLEASGLMVLTTNQEVRIPSILAAIEAAIDQRTGCTFGVAGQETLMVDPRFERGYFGRFVRHSSLAHTPGLVTLALPKPIRQITTIVENVDTFAGGAWSGGTTLTVGTDLFLADPVLRLGVYRAVERATGSWTGRVVIAGHWADQVYGTDPNAPAVPDEIVYVTNYLAAETFKKLNASPAGFTDATGAVVPIRNAWKDADVVGAIGKYDAMFAGVMLL